MNFPNKKFLLFAMAGLTAILLVLICAGILSNSLTHHLDPRLVSPAPLIQGLLKTNCPIFLTPEFFPMTASWSGSQKALLPSLAQSTAASRDKSLFWKLNREKHYSAAFLESAVTGELSDSLLQSQLWELSDVSPWGYLFCQKTAQTTAWKIPSEAELLKQWPDAEGRSRFLILTAANLAAINRLDDAEHFLTLGEKLNLLPSLLQSTRASLAASRRDWVSATQYARQSLHSDPTNSAAQEILIRALIEIGNTDAALDQARELSIRKPDNEAALFLLARAANAANSSKEEIEALTRLVTVGRRNAEPLGATLTYLGQAYAKEGNRGDALRSFQGAELAPELSSDQRKIIRELMDHLMLGTSPSSTLPPLQSSPTRNP